VVPELVVSAMIVLKIPVTVRNEFLNFLLAQSVQKRRRFYLFWYLANVGENPTHRFLNSYKIGI
jgi:hypothetical protein